VQLPDDYAIWTVLIALPTGFYVGLHFTVSIVEISGSTFLHLELNQKSDFKKSLTLHIGLESISCELLRYYCLNQSLIATETKPNNAVVLKFYEKVVKLSIKKRKSQKQLVFDAMYRLHGEN
jgi:hypothetical protein